MAERGGGSNTFWWTLIGVCLGVAGTLIVILVTGRHGRETDDQDAAPVAVAHAPHKHALAVQPESVPPSSAAPTIDQQVAEDAAAAGLTSRTRTPQ